MNNGKSFDPRSMGGGRRLEAGLGDDVPCSKCGSALDTGLECTECGHDMRPEIYPTAESAAQSILQKGIERDKAALRAMDSTLPPGWTIRAFQAHGTNNWWVSIESPEYGHLNVLCRKENAVRMAHALVKFAVATPVEE